MYVKGEWERNCQTYAIKSKNLSLTKILHVFIFIDLLLKVHCIGKLMYQEITLTDLYSINYIR